MDGSLKHVKSNPSYSRNKDSYQCCLHRCRHPLPGSRANETTSIIEARTEETLRKYQPSLIRDSQVNKTKEGGHCFLDQQNDQPNPADKLGKFDTYKYKVTR